MARINSIISPENEEKITKQMIKMYEAIDKSYGDEKDLYYALVEDLNKQKREHWKLKKLIKKLVKQETIVSKKSQRNTDEKYSLDSGLPASTDEYSKKIKFNSSLKNNFHVTYSSEKYVVQENTYIEDVEMDAMELICA